MPQLQVFLSDDNRIFQDLGEEKVTIGRLPDNTLQIDEGSVSSRHAEISYEGGHFHYHDLGSTNGSFVNGEQTTEAVLRHGDEVRIGQVECVFFDESLSIPASQSLPEAATSYVQIASQSARPANFASASPVPKKAVAKDPFAAVAYGLGGLALLAAAATVVYVFTVQPPG